MDADCDGAATEQRFLLALIDLGLGRKRERDRVLDEFKRDELLLFNRDRTAWRSRPPCASVAAPR